MRKILLTMICFFLIVAVSYGANGLIVVKSANSVKETADKLEKVLLHKGMIIFARINHAEGAKKAGEKLRATELIIFGNPKIGAQLMQSAQTSGIDLPLKALIWEDKSGQVWIAYNDPQYVANRHNIKDCGNILAKMKKALSEFVKAAATK